MQDQDLYLGGSRVSKTGRILLRHVHGDCDIPGESTRAASRTRREQSRKRKDVSVFVLAAESQVESANRFAAGDQHVRDAAQTRHLPGSPDESFDRRFGEPRDSFVQNDQRSLRRKIGRTSKWEGRIEALPFELRTIP